MLDPKKGRFTGHHTFVLRYGWPKKVYDCLKSPKNQRIFSAEDAIAQFGVGKNMVHAMQHWTHACGIIEQDGRDSKSWRLTEFGELLLGRHDPFLEHAATPWLLHWNLTRSHVSAVLCWLFGYYTDAEFSAKTALEALKEYLNQAGAKAHSDTTLQRDLDCALRAYLPRHAGSAEEDLDSPLADLRLLEAAEPSRLYRLRRTERTLLPDAVFAYGLLDFWRSCYAKAGTLAFDAAMYRPGGPGTTFRLSEHDLADRAQALEELTNGQIRWSETAGLRQWQRTGTLAPEALLPAMYS